MDNQSLTEQAMKASHNFSPTGVRIEDGRLMLRYLSDEGVRVTLDLTAEIEKIAEAKVQEHMKAWHGHNL